MQVSAERIEVSRRIESSDSAPIRLGWLDSLRGLAAGCVFLAHFAPDFDSRFRLLSNGYFHLGTFAVFLFLCISGYIIPFSLERNNHLGAFWVSRFFRLFPLFYVLFIPYTIYLITVAKRPPTLADVAANSVMLQVVFGKASIIVPSWSLSIEMCFYMISSVLFALGWHKQSFTVSLVALVVLLVSLSFLPTNDYEHAFDYVFPFIGTLYFRMGHGKLDARGWIPILVLTAILGALILPSTPIEHDWSRGKAVGGVGAILLFTFLYFRPRLLETSRVFRWLGKISYSTYLIHYFSLTAALIVSRRIHAQGPLEISCCFVLVYGLTLVLSWLLFTFIEQPMIDVGRRLIKRWFPHRARAVVNLGD